MATRNRFEKCPKPSCRLPGGKHFFHICLDNPSQTVMWGDRGAPEPVNTAKKRPKRRFRMSGERSPEHNERIRDSLLAHFERNRQTYGTSRI